MNCVIDIKSLSSGAHSQDFEIGKGFFESFGSEEILDASLDVKVDITKSSEFIGVVCSIVGEVVVECDRCLAELKLPISITTPFTVKFSTVENQGVEYGDDVILLAPSEGELDMSQIIYDYVSTSLPLKKVHDEGECDPAMVDKIRELVK